MCPRDTILFAQWDVSVLVFQMSEKDTDSLSQTWNNSSCSDLFVINDFRPVIT